jgi:hypothetical protein
VDDPHPPYSLVQVQGVAEVSEDPQDVLDIATRTGGRYFIAERDATVTLGDERDATVTFGV